MPHQIDVSRLINHLGGFNALAQELKEYGFTPLAPIAVSRWIERGSIPSGRLAELMMLAHVRGERIDLYDFIVFYKPDDPTFVARLERARAASAAAARRRAERERAGHA